MKFLVVALAMAAAASATSASGFGTPGVANGQGETVPIPAPVPTAPSGARHEAEDAVRQYVGQSDGVRFRTIRVMEAASVRRSPFAPSFDGPATVVCGQYSSPDPTGASGAYSWFFVAMKGDDLLWTSADKAAGGPGEAFYSCDKAGLTPAGAAREAANVHGF